MFSSRTSALCSISRLPLSAVDPRHRHVLQNDHHGERQSGGVIVKHGDKVVAWALDKQQAAEESHNAAAHWNKAAEVKLIEMNERMTNWSTNLTWFSQ